MPKNAFFAGFVFFSLAMPLFAAADWRPVTREELALKESKIDPKADAEILFSEVRIEKHTVYSYLRYKIFTERGRDRYSDVKIEYAGHPRVSSVAGRTIHADGTVVELADSVFNTIEAQQGRRKERAYAFTLPAVEIGSIIEYRWSEAFGESVVLEIQDEVPVAESIVRLSQATTSDSSKSLYFNPFFCKPEVSDSGKGYTVLTLRNIAPYAIEPFSPPRLSYRQWILVRYESSFLGGVPFTYWNAVGRDSFAYYKGRLKLKGEFKKAAAETAKGANEEEKLGTLAAYCRSSIKNVETEKATTEERENAKANKTVSEALERHTGTSEDINLVFVALAEAAGFDARPAWVAGRKSFIFSPGIATSSFLTNLVAAVSVKGKWKFYDVADEAAPVGTLNWSLQGAPALLFGPEVSNWVETPLLTADETRIERMAHFILSPEGDLEGDVRELYWGNESINMRTAYAPRNETERGEAIHEKLKLRFPDFEVTDIHFVMAPDVKRPVGINYHVCVKGYAQRTGKRLLVRPNFFTFGGAAYFTSEVRKNRVYFPFPWSEQDFVSLQIPQGFTLDNAEAPQSFEFLPTGKYLSAASLTPSTNTLTYRRRFVFGTEKLAVFEPAAYGQLKRIFDQLHTNDDHLIALKQEAALADTTQ